MEDGVWRTIAGRRVFIKKGQSLTEAMRDSGKFGNKKEEQSLSDAMKDSGEFSSKSKFKNGYGKTSTEDSLGNDSLAKYMDKDGNITPEREKVHKEIIDKHFEGLTPVSDEEKTYYMTGGGSGTGKSNFLKRPEEFMGQSKNTVIVDSDEIKKMFPDFDKNDVKSASYFHEESSAVAKRIVRIAQDNNYNVLLDGTGDGGLKGLRKKIKDAKERGYKIKACYGTCSMEEALIRNQKRYDGAIARGEVARRVPEKEVLKTHKKVSALLPEVASEFDSVEVYDFNDFNNIKHIATGGSGKPLTPTKEYEKEYNEFLEKAKVKINE